ncbi:hypothetical protein BJF79_17310, partial [Actinomadura sp. CNU-125]
MRPDGGRPGGGKGARWALIVPAGVFAVVLAAGAISAAVFLTSSDQSNERPGGASGSSGSSASRSPGGGSAGAIDVPDGYEPYQGPGFTVAVPEGWKAEASGDDVTFTDPAEGSRRGIAVQRIAGAAADLGGSLADAAQNFAEDQSYKDYEQLDFQRNMQYRGQSAAQLEFTFTQDGVAGRCRVRVFRFNDAVYQTVLVSRIEQWDGVVPHYDTFMETLRAPDGPARHKVILRVSTVRFRSAQAVTGHFPGREFPRNPLTVIYMPQVIAGRYELVEPLGHHGTGLLWRARDLVLDREVAVQEVSVDHLGDDPAGRARARVAEDARAATRLDHPSIVTVHDVVEEDGRPWIVMQLVRARSLAATVERDGPLPPERVAAIGLDLLDALRAAHAAGIVHGDVEPGDVLLPPGPVPSRGADQRRRATSGPQPPTCSRESAISSARNPSAPTANGTQPIPSSRTAAGTLYMASSGSPAGAARRMPTARKSTRTATSPMPAAVSIPIPGSTGTGAAYRLAAPQPESARSARCRSDMGVGTNPSTDSRAAYTRFRHSSRDSSATSGCSGAGSRSRRATSPPAATASTAPSAAANQPAVSNSGYSPTAPASVASAAVIVIRSLMTRPRNRSARRQPARAGSSPVRAHAPPAPRPSGPSPPASRPRAADPPPAAAPRRPRPRR